MATMDDLRSANPYANQSKNYFKSWWQTMASDFGLRTEADAWRENMGVQSAEYNAALLQKEYDNEYNSPIAQASRMRAAGLNPDLQGIGDANTSASMGEDPSTPMQSTGQEHVVQNVVSGVFNAFNTALGVAKGLQGMHSVFLDNSLKEVTIDQGISEYAKKMWPYFLPDSPDPSAENDISLTSNPFDWKALALKNATSFAGNINKKYRKRFIDEVQNYWNSGPGQFESYDAWTKRVKSRKDFYMERDSFYSDVDDVLNDMISPLANVLMQVQSQDLDTRLNQSQAADAQAEYDKELYGENGLDPKAEAGALNSERGLAETNNSMVNALNDSIGDIIGNLKKTADNEHGLKGALANIALVLMASVRLYLANNSGPLISSRSTNNYSTTNNTSKNYW